MKRNFIALSERFAVGTVHHLGSTGLQFVVSDIERDVMGRIRAIEFTSAKGTATLYCSPQWATANFLRRVKLGR